MANPQGGVFALGTSAHAYLEFDADDGVDGREVVTALSSLREPRTTMGGVNLVAGFRPELWQRVVPDDAPDGLAGFNEELVGPDGFVMPATQHDAVLWLSGSATDVVFDAGRGVIAAVAGLASVAAETSSWPYRHDLDLTGFIDGTENPTLLDAPGIVLVPEGSPGAGGSVLLLQKWEHDPATWEALLRRTAGAGDRSDEARERRARGQAGRLARGKHGPGPVRPHLPPQHPVRDDHRPRNHVRGLQCRPVSRSPPCWRAWRAGRVVFVTHSPSTPAPDRRLLLRSVRRRPDAVGGGAGVALSDHVADHHHGGRGRPRRVRGDRPERADPRSASGSERREMTAAGSSTGRPARIRLSAIVLEACEPHEDHERPRRPGEPVVVEVARRRPRCR